jgi:hypothetical protein
MSDQTLTDHNLPDDVLNTEAIDLGEDAFATLSALWGVGEADVDEALNEIMAEREADEIFGQAYIALEPSLFEVGGADLSGDLPDWLNDLDSTVESSALDFDF